MVARRTSTVYRTWAISLNLTCDSAISLGKEDVEITSINIMGLFFIFLRQVPLLSLSGLSCLMRGEICKIFGKRSECVIWTLTPRDKKIDMV